MKRLDLVSQYYDPPEWPTGKIQIGPVPTPATGVAVFAYRVHETESRTAVQRLHYGR